MRGLVNGLQNRLHPFESGTDLTKKDTGHCIFFYVFGSVVLHMIAHTTFTDTICWNMCLRPKWVSANHDIRTECLCLCRQVLRVQPHQQFQSLPLEELRWLLHRLLC